MPEDFLKNLPASLGKAKSRRLKLFQEGRLEQKLERLREVKLRVTKEIEVSKGKLDDIKTKKTLVVNSKGITIIDTSKKTLTPQKYSS